MAYRKFANTKATALAGAVTASDTTIIVVDGSSYPDPAVGGNGPYTLLLAYGSDREEVVTVTAKPNANTFTVTRGEDGASATAKNVGDVVVHGVSKRDWEDLLPKAGGTMTGPLIVPDGTAAGHAVNKGQLDTKTSVTSATPTALTPDIAGAVGVGTTAARSDHVHNVPAAAPAANLTASTVNAEGSAASFARSDHSHAITANVAPSPLGTAAVGTSAALARADHVHAMPTAANVGAEVAGAVAAHVAAADPHTGYATDADLTAHAAAADPHTGYQKESEKGAANGYASLDASTKVPVAQVPTGTSGSTVALGNHAHAGVYDPAGSAAAVENKMGGGMFSTGTLVAGRNTFTVPFGRTFPSVPNVVAQPMTGVSTELYVYWWVTNVTTTGFQLDVWRANTTAMVFQWIAIAP